MATISARISARMMILISSSLLFPLHAGGEPRTTNCATRAGPKRGPYRRDIVQRRPKECLAGLPVPNSSLSGVSCRIRKRPANRGDGCGPSGATRSDAGPRVVPARRACPPRNIRPRFHEEMPAALPRSYLYRVTRRRPAYHEEGVWRARASRLLSIGCRIIGRAGLLENVRWPCGVPIFPADCAGAKSIEPPPHATFVSARRRRREKPRR